MEGVKSQIKKAAAGDAQRIVQPETTSSRSHQQSGAGAEQSGGFGEQAQPESPHPGLQRGAQNRPQSNALGNFVQSQCQRKRDAKASCARPLRRRDAPSVQKRMEGSSQNQRRGKSVQQGVAGGVDRILPGGKARRR